MFQLVSDAFYEVVYSTPDRSRVSSTVFYWETVVLTMFFVLMYVLREMIYVARVKDFKMLELLAINAELSSRSLDQVEKIKCLSMVHDQQLGKLIEQDGQIKMLERALVADWDFHKDPCSIICDGGSD